MTQEPRTPATEAGRALLAELTMGYEDAPGDVVMPAVKEGMAKFILAIEAEARATAEAERDRLRFVLQRLGKSIDGEWHFRDCLTARLGDRDLPDDEWCSEMRAALATPEEEA